MKLSRLYSNDDRFHSIVFNDGMNIVLPFIRQRLTLI